MTYKTGDWIPTRDAYGEALCELGEKNKKVVVFEADISKSTRTNLFGKKFPERYFNVGVAEQNEMAIAAGAAMCGKISFVSTYAVFASMRACEQVRTFVAYPHLNVKICPSHGGITPANDGVTHQGTEDLGIMRTIPGMTVLMPADANATKKLLFAAAEWDGPVYLRLTRDSVPIIYDEKTDFTIGKGILLREGKDVTIIALGDMVSKALDAANLLSTEEISAEVIDMHTIKPLDGDIILNSVKKTRTVVTVEDHQVECGLGGAVSEFLGENYPVPVRRIGFRNTFAESGEYELLLEKYGMSVKHITAGCLNSIKMKGKIR
ncbi:MAG: transketolase family protein [Candidatus Omnitrophica bacterium]|nr:transketolase family protein [Candidatus Omnitrophota bacterium]